ncbi:MAG: tRNA (5-methylaminomethyl-2-thiouridine)(34)-methyltransferase MnmD [Bacteroidia bacterium]|nr:tRNA (5-methylaminomethyl-2-thiouridine)(34)-methyltransferase MnmD [Bacteroidia bacterium]NNF30308.1 tRNA (5-methylaminomethyl-2-thiouridine)(34)-methyltransferase MnmD [Flavobacteriaceae bacterium]MBT8276384.1 tRNA (5-methylaminomethyl-2-thiouridine)(34)-methyltransferase MnmD [Bacteroidia bacterium]NNJ80983.1 tRNA (5-methylaminomethyl-2-thiouridine)(34)-methyltransferase MnmD [Flavobacteriaceae bacterium]NNK53547.1 tRNA (5-methylaminomethyl-2-thiouridine)(34)-methyltransferase MnmD [Flavo
MKREFLITGDGSVTIHLPEWNEQYHSKHGAIAEAAHVFISSGFEYLFQQNPDSLKELYILEMGFGTGLNAYLTLLQTFHKKIKIHYTGVDAYPVDTSEVDKLNYPDLVKGSEALFLKLHEISWDENTEITDHFHLLKQKKQFSEVQDENQYDLIFFDAFGPRVQPELWTETIFKAMFRSCRTGGVLVTYSAKGSVRRAMESVGFKVERLPGPPGKREMLRAIKSS